MKFVIQRVTDAQVTVEGTIIGKIGKGLMILVGLTHDDKEEYIEHITDKFLNLRLFDGTDGTRWKESVKSLGLEILLVSQFTLYSFMKGNKPDFHYAMDNEPARIMFDKIVKRIKEKYDPAKIQTGAFGEYMMVNLTNDGPVTIEWEYPGDKLDNIINNNVKKGKREDVKQTGEIKKKRGEKKEKNKSKDDKKEENEVKKETKVSKEIENNKVVENKEEDKKELEMTKEDKKE